jgi:hypothetical protein
MEPRGRVESFQAMIKAHGLSAAVLFYSRDAVNLTGAEEIAWALWVFKVS